MTARIQVEITVPSIFGRRSAEISTPAGMVDVIATRIPRFEEYGEVERSREDDRIHTLSQKDFNGWEQAFPSLFMLICTFKHSFQNYVLVSFHVS